MASALEGLRVIDFGQYVAGPAVAMMLADFGAEVIRIDPPDGPRWRSPAARVLNRGKRSIALDLKSAGDRAIALRLIDSADIVIENYRPGVMARFGLDADRMRRRNPRLIYLSLPGFASDDPELRDVQAWEAVIAAATGQFTDMGLNRVLMGVNPSFSPITLASAYAALLGATAVAAALYARERTGRGDAIETPIAACLLEGLAYNAMHVEGYPERYKSLRERELDRRRREQLPMSLSWAECQAFCDPFYRVYRCADGRFFYPVAGSHSAHPVRVLELLGLWDALKDELAVFDAFLNTDEWPDPPGFTLSNYPVPKPWADKLASLMAARFQERTALEWQELFGENRTPGAAVRTTDEWLASEHARQSGLIVTLDDPELGPLSGLGKLAWFGDDHSLPDRPAPRLDADREAILATLDRAAPPSADVAPAAYLDGVRVLDLCNVLAGPQISQTLMRFGPQVDMLGPIKSTMDPWNTVIYGLQVAQGKRSALADIKSPAGRRLLDQLLARADIVTYNGPDRQLEALGLSPDRLRAVNPNLILCKLDCYGGPRVGPRSHHPGYDDTTQASTGVMARFGGMETPEEHAHMGTIDVLGGIAGAFGACVALYSRSRGDERRFVKTSLAAVGQLIQTPFMVAHPERPPFAEPSGREVLGEGPFYRCYEALDGWMFVVATPERVSALGALLDLADLEAMAPATQEAQLAAAFAARGVMEWRRRLSAAGCVAEPLGSLEELRRRFADPADLPPPKGRTYRFVRHERHPCGRTVTLVDTAGVRLAEAPILRGAPAPKYGQDTREILAELGYAPNDVEALFKMGVVSERWSKDYMPT